MEVCHFVACNDKVAPLFVLLPRAIKKILENSWKRDWKFRLKFWRMRDEVVNGQEVIENND